MRNRLKRLLPILAVGGALTVVIVILIASRCRYVALSDTGRTRHVVKAALSELQALHPASIDDAGFRRAVEQLTRARHVATVWLFAPNGRIVYSAGSTARSTASYRTVEEASTNDTRRLLEALPEGALSNEQRLWMLAVSAMRREGEHGDVYRHLLRPIETTDGSTVALVGTAYNVSASGPGIGWRLLVLGGFAGLGVYWLSVPLWVLLDARERGERAGVWATFVFMGNLVSLIGYILARVPGPETTPSD